MPLYHTCCTYNAFLTTFTFCTRPSFPLQTIAHGFSGNIYTYIHIYKCTSQNFVLPHATNATEIILCITVLWFVFSFSFLFIVCFCLFFFLFFLHKCVNAVCFGPSRAQYEGLQCNSSALFCPTFTPLATPLATLCLLRRFAFLFLPKLSLSPSSIFVLSLFLNSN